MKKLLFLILFLTYPLFSFSNISAEPLNLSQELSVATTQKNKLVNLLNDGETSLKNMQSSIKSINLGNNPNYKMAVSILKDSISKYLITLKALSKTLAREKLKSEKNISYLRTAYVKVRNELESLYTEGPSNPFYYVQVLLHLDPLVPSTLSGVPGNIADGYNKLMDKVDEIYKQIDTGDSFEESIDQLFVKVSVDYHELQEKKAKLEKMLEDIVGKLPTVAYMKTIHKFYTQLFDINWIKRLMEGSLIKDFEDGSSRTVKPGTSTDLFLGLFGHYPILYNDMISIAKIIKPHQYSHVSPIQKDWWNNFLEVNEKEYKKLKAKEDDTEGMPALEKVPLGSSSGSTTSQGSSSSVKQGGSSGVKQGAGSQKPAGGTSELLAELLKKTEKTKAELDKVAVESSDQEREKAALKKAKKELEEAQKSKSTEDIEQAEKDAKKATSMKALLDAKLAGIAKATQPDDDDEDDDWDNDQ